MKTIDLSGSWKVFLDPEDAGIRTRWFETLGSKEGSTIQLPGSLELARIGAPVDGKTQWVGSQFGKEYRTDELYAPYREDGDYRFIYWLQPETRYIGPAWYVREIEFPAEEYPAWELTLERPHWETRVWFEASFLGQCDSLCVPHRYTLAPKPGARGGTLVVRVDNRMIWETGPNAHSISDHTQGCWNGIAGKIELSARACCSFSSIHLYPDRERKSILAEIKIRNSAAEEVFCTLESFSVRAAGNAKPEKPFRFAVPPEGRAVYREILLDQSSSLWDEFSPELVAVDIALSDGTGKRLFDRRSIKTGIRDVQSSGKSILVNGNPIFLRGTLECCVFPKTGHPPTDAGEWRSLYRRAKEFGLNHIRFHSWCPPEAAFAAADIEGIYLQVECPVWKNQGVKYEGNPGFDDWLFREAFRIIEEYGNHPSFIMFNSGNEPDGRFEEFLGLWTEHWKRRDGRRLYNASSGWPVIAENEFQVAPQPRLQAWGEGLASPINAHPPETESDYEGLCSGIPGPVITHEMGQWCAFPDFSETEKYTGYLKARNFEVFADILRRRGMEGQARDFLFASGKLQTLCYKEDIEKALRTRNLSGFQLLGLTDFPGQGTALVGVLNAFWEEKGYCTASEFHEFCGPVVLLARIPKRCYTTEETFSVSLEVRNHSAGPLADSSAGWKLLDVGGRAIAAGRLELPDPLQRGLQSIGNLSITLAGIKPPSKLTLRLELPETGVKNHWDIWVYPDRVEIPTGITMAERLDAETVKMLTNGETVLLAADPGSVASDAAIGFSSVFWNTSWTEGQAPHTLGFVCDEKHPVFSDFPTGPHSDWQWWEIMNGSAAMILDDLTREIVPLIQPIDTWFRSHRLALLFECRVGKGRLMVSSADFSQLGARIALRQFLFSILSYMQSPAFNPKAELDSDSLNKLFRR